MKRLDLLFIECFNVIWLIRFGKQPGVDSRVQRFDPALENLAPAQKQLMRMGPRNTKIIQAKLREIATALGIDANRLPPPADT